jgi:mannose-6-phosphate isomerase-like protein (cupin superfamily)
VTLPDKVGGNSVDWTSESIKLREERGIRGYEPLQPFVSQRTLDRSLWYEGQLVVMYAQGSQVGNTCCVWEGNIPETIGPPPHIHLYEHEIFFVIEGHLKAWVEGVEYDVPRDSMIFLPCGRMHWFVSAARCTRIFSLTVTASKEFPNINNNTGLFQFMGDPAKEMTLPPLAEVGTLPDPREIRRVSRESGSDIPDLERVGWRRGYGGGPSKESER